MMGLLNTKQGLSLATDLSFQVLGPVVTVVIVGLAAEFALILWRRRSRRRFEAAKPANFSSSAISLDELKGEITKVGRQLAEIRQCVNRISVNPEDFGKVSRSLDDLRAETKQLGDTLAHVFSSDRSGFNGLAEIQESVREGSREILQSIYSEVNRAAGDTLDTVLDTIKAQMRDLKDDFSCQIQDLTAFIRPDKEQPKEPEPSIGAGASQSGAASGDLASAKKTSIAAHLAVHPIPASSCKNGNSVAAEWVAATAREIAGAVEALEGQFQFAKLEVPPIAISLRSRLLHVESLARSVNSPGKYPEIEEHLAPDLDEIIGRDLPELVKICDSAERSGVFDEAVRKLLEAAHLRDTSPRPGDRYDPAQHAVVDFENGNPGVILRTKSRGFHYKEQLLRKPEVIVGI